MVLAIISAALMVHGQAAKPHSDADKRHPATENKSASDSSGRMVIVVNQQTSKEQDKDQASKPPSYLHELLVPANLPNLLLVGVGIYGIRIAIRTLRSIEKQANLMQAQFDQWVVLTKWRTWNQPRNNVLRITVDLINPTDFPITLSEGYLKFSKGGVPYAKYILGEKTFLSPKLPKPIELDITLTDAEQAAYSVRFMVEGVFSHFHRISRKPITQRVEGSLDCSPWKSDMKWHATFTDFLHMNPETQKGQAENPN